MHPLTAWFALAGCVWAIFALAQERLSPEQRVQMTAWLRGQAVPWPATFVAICESVFGRPSWRSAYLLRGCVACNIAAFLSLCLAGVWYPGTSGGMLLALLLYAPWLSSALAIVNWLPGLSALALQRTLLVYARDARPPLAPWAWCCLASVSTGVLALLAWLLTLLVVYSSAVFHLLRWPATWLQGYSEFAFSSVSSHLRLLQEAAMLQPVIVPNLIFPPLGIWLYAPCFPLLWLGLYRLAGVCLRGATACGFFTAPRQHLRLVDLEARPVHALGAVAVALVSLVYWLAVLWCR